MAKRHFRLDLRSQWTVTDAGLEELESAPLGSQIAMIKFDLVRPPALLPECNLSSDELAPITHSQLCLPSRYRLVIRSLAPSSTGEACSFCRASQVLLPCSLVTISLLDPQIQADKSYFSISDHPVTIDSVPRFVHKG